VTWLPSLAPIAEESSISALLLLFINMIVRGPHIVCCSAFVPSHCILGLRDALEIL
jgi:hypothetical protein